MTRRLTGRTALVTGAAAGIGESVARRFVAEGARVVFADRDGDRAQTAATAAAVAAAAAADGAPTESATARRVTMDITDESSVESAFADLAVAGWAPDVVVANAGIQLFGQDAPVADLDLEVWRRTIDTNLTGTFLTVKHAVRSMLAHAGGSLILTGSPTGLTGEGAEFTAYSSSKAGIHGLTRTVAAAYAAQGIRANTVVPGYTETGLVTAIRDDPEARAGIVGRIPLGRAGTPADVEGVMVFLASDDAAFATGSLFAVDGGMTAL